MIGYKIAQVQLNNQDIRRVLVTLEISDDAKTNLHRKDIVDATKAKYRCNKAKVLKIEDNEGREYPEATTHCYQDKKLKYAVGEVEEKNYNTDIEVVCGEGIHFFLDKEVALLYGLDTLKDGLYTSWYDNGQKWVECHYRDGKLDGLYQRWWKNGQKSAEYTYRDGKEEGLFQRWFENGQKSTECTCRDGKEEGLCQRWWYRGQKEVECTYRDGKREGLCKVWNFNGELIKECTYRDNKEV
jgi:antitoxin component YwqK of YwqJK toxin-antitoxin module